MTRIWVIEQSLPTEQTGFGFDDGTMSIEGKRKWNDMKHKNKSCSMYTKLKFTWKLKCCYNFVLASCHSLVEIRISVLKIKAANNVHQGGKNPEKLKCNTWFSTHNNTNIIALSIRSIVSSFHLPLSHDTENHLHQEFFIMRNNYIYFFLSSSESTELKQNCK